MCHPVCEMMHIKEALLLIGKSSPCSGGSGFPPLLSFAVIKNVFSVSLNKTFPSFLTSIRMSAANVGLSL